MNEFYHEFLFPLIPWFLYVYMAFRCRKYRQRVEEFENKLNSIYLNSYGKDKF